MRPSRRYEVLIDPPCAACQNTSVGGGTTRTVVTGLAVGTAYRFQVVARNRVGAGPASAPSDPPVRPIARTRAMTWNLKRGELSGMPPFATLILFHEADVVGVQEILSSQADELRSELQARSGVTWYLHKDGTNAILSRYPLTNLKQQRFSNEPERGIISAVYTETPSGQPIHVYDAHLTATGDRQTQTRKSWQ